MRVRKGPSRRAVAKAKGEMLGPPQLPGAAVADVAAVGATARPTNCPMVW